MNYKIGVIGSESLLFPFLQFGFETHSPVNDEALRKCILEMIDNNFGIVYIEDSYATRASDILDSRKDAITPVFIPLGEDAEGDSYSKRQINKMVEKAIGQNILK